MFSPKYSFYVDRWREYHPELPPGATERQRLQYRVDMHQKKIGYHDAWRKDYERMTAKQLAMRSEGTTAQWEHMHKAALAAQKVIREQRLKAGLSRNEYRDHPLNKAYMKQARLEKVAEARLQARGKNSFLPEVKRKAKGHARAAAKQRAKLQKNLACLRALKRTG